MLIPVIIIIRKFSVAGSIKNRHRQNERLVKPRKLSNYISSTQSKKDFALSGDRTTNGLYQKLCPRLKSPLKVSVWAVVVAQLAERSIPIPEDLGSNPVISNFY